MDQRHRTIPTLLALLVLATMSLLAGWLFQRWRESQPHWEVSARDTSTGLWVEIYKSDEATPTYEVMLEGRRASREFARVGRDELGSDAGTTTFADDTLKPGRWTVEIGGTEFDIMEARLIVNDQVELTPGQTRHITPEALPTTWS